MYKVLVNILILVVLVLSVNMIMYVSLISFNSLKMFECGFDTMFWTHPKLSVHFFKIGIIFILFDLELMLLLLSFTNFVLLVWFLMMFIYWSIFLEFLLMGFKWST